MFNVLNTARGPPSIGQRQTEPHIGWMLFENDAQTIVVQTVVIQFRRLESYLARTASLEAWPLGTS